MKVPKRLSVYVTMITELTPILCDLPLTMYVRLLAHKYVPFQYYENFIIAYHMHF